MTKALKIAKKSWLLGVALLAAVLIFTAQNAAFAQWATDESLQLTQYSATLGLNQRITVVSFNASDLTVSGGGKIVKASVAGGNQVSLYGLRVGNAVVKVCSADLGCKNINIKIQKSKVALFKLARTSAYLKAGQKTIITTTNGREVTALSNSGVATAYAQNNKVYITGERAGSATVTVCSVNLGCLPIFVKVTGYREVIKNQGSNNQTNNNPDAALSLSSQNVTVQENKSVDITANYSEGLTAVSDSGAVRTAVNGNRITVYGTYIGSASVKVCKVGKNCVAVSATVIKADATYTAVSGVRVSDSKLELFAGQKAWVLVSGSNKLKVYTNNSGVARPTLKGNLLLIATGYTGKAQITVCSEDDGCVGIDVVSKTTNLKKLTGTFRTIDQPKGTTKTYNFNFYNATTYYIQNTTNNNLVSVTMQSGNPFNLTVSTYDVGTSLTTICPYVSTYKCGTVAVNIIDPLPTEPTQKISLSDNVMTVRRGETATVTANMNYSMAAFSENESVRTAVNGNQISLYGIQLGASNVTVCSTNNSCANVYVKVVD